MHSTILSKILTRVGIILFLLVLPLACAAQNISPRLAVSPHTFDLGVLPGEVRTGKIKITNKSRVALPILAKTTDFSAADEEGGISFDEFSQDISFASRKWIKIKNPNFILSPGETEEVYFTIKVPGSAEPGGHYATMLFEPQLPSYYFKEGQPRAIPVIGVLFLFSVQTLSLEPQAHQKLEVVEFSVPKRERLLILENLASKLIGSIAQAAANITITKKSPQSFILRIKNNDIYHTKPFGKVLIYNIFGKKAGEAEIPQKTILPGRIRRFPIQFTPQTPEKLKWLPASISEILIQNFFIGKYQAKIKLQAKSPLTTEVFQPEIPVILTFFSLPWKFWLIFILVFGALVFLTTKYKRRIKLAARTLINPKSK